MIIGIDDVTRSPVIGDLIIAGVVLNRMSDLDGLNIKDSKEMTREQRNLIYPEIYKRAKNIFIEFITPAQIDNNNLNDLEAKAIINILNKCNTLDKIYVDNWEHSFNKFIERLQNNCGNIKLIDKNLFVAEHNADKNYKIVSAASIVAKVISDLQYDSYKQKYDFGSGNPNDKKTIKFLKQHLSCPPNCEGCKIIRKKWITYKRLKKNL